MKKGFTLIELLTSVFIIALLLAIAYPSYQHYLIRIHRNDAKTALYDLAARMENYYAEHQTYLGASIGKSNTHDIRNSTISPEGWYSLSIIQQNATAYTLQATPIGKQGLEDTACQSFTLNHLGQKKLASGSAGLPTESVEHCW